VAVSVIAVHNTQFCKVFKYPSTFLKYRKGKGKAYLYSAFRETSSQGAQVWITHGCPCKLYTIPAYTLRTFARWRHLNGRQLIQLATHLSTPEGKG